MHDRGSKNRLMPQHATLFAGHTLFQRLARAVCDAGVLPRKELYEAWELARRARRRFRGGRVIDFAAGHGLLAHVMVLLDQSSTAVAWDVRPPPSAKKLADALAITWPELRERVTFATTAPSIEGSDLVVSCHACGALTDEVLELAMAVRARVAVMPCCHDSKTLDVGGLSGWMDPALAIDATRVARLRSDGYEVWTQRIAADITPKNRLLLAAISPALGDRPGMPPESDTSARGVLRS
jgi:hypothetical protein